MTTITKSALYNLKWRLKSHRNYQWSECGKLFNVLTGKEIKKTVNGYSVGYWIGKKFMTLDNLRKELEVLPYFDCPF